MYTPSARLSPTRSPQRSPFRPGRGSSAEYSEINLQNLSEDESEQIIMENDPSRRGSGFRTLVELIRENRKYQLAIVVVLVMLLITIPLAATSGNKSGAIEGGDESLDIGSNALGAAGGDESGVDAFSGSSDEDTDADTDADTNADEDTDFSDSDTHDDYECKSDRLTYQDPLHANQFICSRKGGYIFGMDKYGRLIYKDIDSGDTEIYYDGEPDEYFILHEDGAFLVKDKDDEIMWAKVSTYRMEPDRNCLEDYPCPYLHLHKDGVLVLNWIDEKGFWDTKNFKLTLFDLEWSEEP